jgi:hypothetical protein
MQKGNVHLKQQQQQQQQENQHTHHQQQQEQQQQNQELSRRSRVCVSGQRTLQLQMPLRKPCGGASMRC